jgi:hypothetical protein
MKWKNFLRAKVKKPNRSPREFLKSAFLASFKTEEHWNRTGIFN